MAELEFGMTSTSSYGDASLLQGQIGRSKSTDATRETATSHFSIHAQKNSLVMTGFLLLNSMIGSGILNQPQVYESAGMLTATIMSVCAAALIWLGIIALVDNGVEHRIYDYSELAKLAFGKAGEVIVDISIAVGNIGALLSYIVVIGSTSSGLLNSWGCNSVGCEEYVITSIIMTIFVFPVCLLRNFGHLAFYSIISMIAIGSVVLLTVIGGPIIGGVNNKVVAAQKSGVVSQLGSIIFALSCAFATFHTFKSIEDDHCNARSWRRVSGITVTMGFIMCFIIGVAGYSSFGVNTQGIILSNFTGHYADPFRIMLIIHLILYIPVDFTTLRHSLIKLAGIERGQVESEILHSIITGLLLGGNMGVVFLLYSSGLTSGNAFSLILDFTGGLAASMTSFILPGAFYLKLMPRTAPLWYPCVFMLLVGVVIAIVVPIYSVMQYY